MPKYSKGPAKKAASRSAPKSYAPPKAKQKQFKQPAAPQSWQQQTQWQQQNQWQQPMPMRGRRGFGRRRGFLRPRRRAGCLATIVVGVVVLIILLVIVLMQFGQRVVF